jgi:hypothetical protein
MQGDRSSYCHPSNILWIQIPQTTVLWVIYYVMTFFSVYLSTSESSKHIHLQSPSPPLLSLCTTISILAVHADIRSGDKIWMLPPPCLDSTPSSTVYPLYRFHAHSFISPSLCKLVLFLWPEQVLSVEKKLSVQLFELFEIQ